MRSTLFALVLAGAALAFVAPPEARAQYGPGVTVYSGPSYYPYGYYDGYSPYDDAAPQTYIQRDSGDAVAPAAPPQRSQYSYYCTNPAGYYPQIANCPTGWLTVVPNGAPRAAPAPR